MSQATIAYNRLTAARAAADRYSADVAAGLSAPDMRRMCALCDEVRDALAELAMAARVRWVRC